MFAKAPETVEPIALHVEDTASKEHEEDMEDQQPHEIILASPTASEKSTQSDGWVSAEAINTPTDPIAVSKSLAHELPAGKPWHVVITEQLQTAQAETKAVEEKLGARIASLTQVHAKKISALQLENNKLRAQLGETHAFLAKHAAALTQAAALATADETTLAQQQVRHTQVTSQSVSSYI